MRSLGC